MRPLALLLFTLPLAAAELEFKERFADPATRAAALESLVPGTRDWFFYRALDHQLAGRDAECRATLQHWRAAAEDPEARPQVSDDGLATLENRAAILRYRRQPETALAELAGMLDLKFDHARPDARSEEALPTRLDPQLVSAAAFEADAGRRTRGEPWREASAPRLLADLADPGDLTAEQRRWLLEKLRFAHHPAVIPLVAAGLAERGAEPFGGHRVHRLLSSTQLGELLRLRPELANSEAFVHLHLRKLHPGPETDFALDPAAHAAHLARCREFAAGLPPAFNSLKAHILHHHLRLQRDLGQFPRDDFLAYLALPRHRHPLLRETRPADPAWSVQADADFTELTGCPAIGDDAPLIDALLDHFLAGADSAAEFAPYLPDDALARVHARARLLAGADPAVWGARLDPAAFAALQQETRIDFAPGQPRFFAPDAPVRLTLDLKHTPDLLVRIHELDLPACVAAHGAEPPPDLDLDGLVPHAERTLHFQQPPLARHRETIDLPELAGRGAWAAEFIARGVASRALVRKGRLVPHATPAADGAVVRVFDETGALLRDATVTLGARVLTADDGGRIVVPEAELAAGRTAVVGAPGATPEAPGLAVPLALGPLRPDDLALDARFHVDREALAAGRDAVVRVEPRLTRHGQPVPLELLQQPTLTLTAGLLGGATVERVIAAGVEPAGPFTAPFHVPADARSLTFRLTGRVDVRADARPLELSAQRRLRINGIFDTPRIAAAFFTPVPGGLLLEVRGRNGEPIAGRTVPLRFRHRDFDHPLELRLRTDADGRIDLGPLPDISEVTTAADWLEPATCHPAALLRHAPLPSLLHLAADEKLTLALPLPAAAPDPARFALLEFRGSPALPLRDHSAKLALAGGQLAVGPLPPGSYQLEVPGGRCRIEVSAGVERDGLLVAPARILPRLRPTLPRIARAAADGEALVVQLAGHGPQTRVTLVGTVFAPEWPAAGQLGGFPPPPAPTLVPGFTSSAYQTGRVLDEETRYILERRSAATFPGSLLPRPGLLVNRFSTTEAEGTVLPPLPGEEATGRDASGRAPKPRPGAPEPPADDADVSFPSIDFLAQAPVVRYDLAPAADGSLRVPLADFAGCRLVSVLATDAGHHCHAAVPLPAAPPQLRDRRLARPLDPARHFVGTRRAAVLAAGAEAAVENVLDAEWRAFTTLREVHAWFLGATPDPRLADFSFLPDWPRFDEKRKLALLGTHACHELHLFVARKDPEFFANHVKPTLAEKREPQFLDQYLLGRDLSAYLRPFAWNRLNAAEKALLAQALPEARPRVLADLQQRWELEAPAPAAETLLFTRTLRGADLAAREGPAPDRAAAATGDFHRAAYDHTRAELLAEVDSAWELATPADGAAAAPDEAAMDPFAEPPELPNSVGRPVTRRPAPPPHRTRLWREHNYYEHGGSTGEELVPLGRFWLDLAAWDGTGRFLSPHFNSCTRSPNESLLCLALLDLPFEAPQPEAEVDGARLRVRAKEPLLLFFRDTREADAVAADAPLLVRQGFHRLDDRFHTVAGRKVEHAVEGPFLAGVPYATSLVVTNPAGAGRRIDLFAQVPGGAIPLAGHPATLADTREIEPYGVVSLEAAFYFPAAGSFPVYPLHVSEDATVLAHAAPRTLEVAAAPAGEDRQSWPAVARDGSADEVLARLRADNLHALDLTRLCWRLRDRAFFLAATAILRERLHFAPEVFAYGFHHNDLPAVRDYLENSAAVRQLGGWLESPLLDVRPSVHLGWETYEFDPLVNPRSHRFADKPRLTHDEARARYEQLLDLLAWKPAPGPEDQLVLTWFLLLQDRVEEALARFATVDPAALTGRLAYDYLHCHALFYQSQPAEARAVAARHAGHPLALWRERFAAVVAQADEIAAAAAPGQAPATAPGAAAPALDLAPAADGSLTLAHRGLDRATLRLYGVDLEHLFSNNPFLDQHGGQHAAVRPNHVIDVPLDPAATTTRVELPPAFRRGNVLVTADAGTLRTVRLLDSRELELRRQPGEHLVEVLATASGAPLPRCYVKVYAEMADGETTFYKDGYTDLRGKFDYLAHTALDPARVRRLALLASHPDHGSRTEVFTP